MCHAVTCRKCGKTTWARSSGTPGVMIGGWDVDKLMQTDMTHLVLNNVKLDKNYVDKLKLVGYEPSLTVGGKGYPRTTIRWGKPVIWIVDPARIKRIEFFGPYPVITIGWMISAFRISTLWGIEVGLCTSTRYPLGT